MIIIKSLLFTLMLLCLCYVEGNVLWYVLARFPKIKSINGIGVGKVLCSGYVVLIGISSLIAGLGALIGLDAFVVVLIIMLILASSIVLLTFLVIRSKGEVLIRGSWQSDNRQPLFIIFLLVALVIYLIQVIVVIKYQYNNFVILQDVPIATRVYDTCRLAKGSPMMNIWGILAVAMNIHPMKLLFTILPGPLIGIYYIGYYELIKAMNRVEENPVYNIAGLIAIEIIGIWGYQSDVLMSVCITSAWYTGSTFVIHALLPCVLMMILTISPTLYNVRCDQPVVHINEENEDYQEEWDMKKHKIVNARNLAIALGVVAVLLVACVYILNNKINALHDATANLQQDLSERCRIYEFTNSVGEVEGYLIKGSDDKLTMIGGGNEANAEDLYDFLADYGYEIKNWYLYDKDAENIGAFARCIDEKGIEVDNVYFLNRIDLEDFNK